MQPTDRTIATVAEGRVWLQSRQLRSLTRFFPEVVEALNVWFRDVVLDGELVVCRSDRLDFTARQGRLARPHVADVPPASFLVFDVLEAGGTDLRGYPYRVRRAMLHRLLDGASPPTRARADDYRRHYGPRLAYRAPRCWNRGRGR